MPFSGDEKANGQYCMLTIYCQLGTLFPTELKSRKALYFFLLCTAWNISSVTSPNM